MRLTHGYWEAKDEYDDLDEEIEKKRAKGYPTENTLFEDSITYVDHDAVRAMSGLRQIGSKLHHQPQMLELGT